MMPAMTVMGPAIAPVAQPAAALKEEKQAININVINENKNGNGGDEGAKASDILLAKLVADMNKEKELPYPQTWPDKSI